MTRLLKYPVWPVLNHILRSLRVQAGALAGIYGLLVTLFLILHYTVGESWPIIALLNNGALWIGLLCIPSLMIALAAGHFRWLWTAYNLPGVVAFFFWYGPLFWPNITWYAPANGLELTVITYNAGSTPTRLEQQLAFLSEADIIGFQEYSLGAHRVEGETLEIFADENAIYTHLPIEPGSNEAIRLNEDRRAVAVRAHIKLDGHTIAVYSLHAPRPDISLRPIAYLSQRRTNALHAVLNDMKAYPSTPTIIMCDCNLTERTADYSLMAVHLTDSWHVAGLGLGLTAPAPHRSTGMPFTLGRVDYIWVSHHFEVVSTRLLPSQSDHYPIEARLRLPIANSAT